jgi:hypothetical protein
MAAATIVFGKVTPQRLSFKATLSTGADTQDNASLVNTSGLAALVLTNPPEPSALYGSAAAPGFLRKTFASDADAEDAFRALGGEITMRQFSGTATTVIGIQWKAAGPSTPSLAYLGGADQVLEIVISLPHSIIQ